MDLNVVCRGCLAETDIVDYFKLDEIGLNEQSYKQMLEEVSGYQINVETEPHRLCENCGIVLLEMFKFKQTLNETQEILNQLTSEVTEDQEEGCTTVAVEELELVEDVPLEDTEYALDTGKTIEELMDAEEIEGFENIGLAYVKEENKIDSVGYDSIDPQYTIIEQNKISCPYCETLCSTNQSLSRHMTNQHPDVKPDHACSYCEKSYHFKEWLENHERQCPGARAAKEGMSEFICKYCEKVFGNYRNMRSHVAISHRELERQADEMARGVACPFCSTKLKNLQTLRHHLANVHAEQRTIKCDYCDTFTFTTDLLQIHLTKCKGYLEKLESQQMVCPYCPVVKHGKKKLNAHIVACHTRHTNEVPFECDICHRLLKTKSSLHSHMKVMHMQKDPHKCDHCGEQYKSLSGLKYHIAQYHMQVDNFQCHLCDFETRQEFLLRRHLKRHNGEKNHVCTECGRAFGSLDSLKSHMLVHTDDRPFSCSYCCRTYKSRQKLRQHQRVHEGYRYECPVCQNTFVTNQALRQHVMKNHPEFELPPPGTVMCETKSMLPRRIIQLEKRNDTLGQTTMFEVKEDVQIFGFD